MEVSVSLHSARSHIQERDPEGRAREPDETFFFVPTSTRVMTRFLTCR
jgi:hypothetical protein